MSRRKYSRGVQIFRIAFWTTLALFAVICWWVMIRMPGRSFNGPPPPLTAKEGKLRDQLKADVTKLGSEIGERNLLRYPQLVAAADFIQNQLAATGMQVRRDRYQVNGKGCDDLEAELPGASSEIVLVGAHYDSVPGAPGANDNGSGIAGVLALARHFAGSRNRRTLRFVAFVNEEPIYFQTSQMGSLVYANKCRQRGDRIVAMISLETIGYFSDQPGSQKYPALGLNLLYPRTGNFIGFVSDLGSRALLRQVIGEFRKSATIPSEGGAMPAMVPGVGWSDQWSFWQNGYPGIMVTDTAPFRYPHYHKATDTPDKLNFNQMTRVVAGLEPTISTLANSAQ